jgi:hypothetical protein
MTRAPNTREEETIQPERSIRATSAPTSSISTSCFLMLWCTLPLPAGRSQGQTFWQSCSAPKQPEFPRIAMLHKEGELYA